MRRSEAGGTADVLPVRSELHLLAITDFRRSMKATGILNTTMLVAGAVHRISCGHSLLREYALEFDCWTARGPRRHNSYNKNSKLGGKGREMSVRSVLALGRVSLEAS